MGKKIAKPKLTISLLASNRPDTIRRCLDSLNPIREAISSELILVDTSENPEIHKILLEYTDQVYEFEWCNDFSKARNVGLKKAKGEWFMFLDDDEWFVDVEELIRFFRSGEYKSYACADHRIRNFLDPEFTRHNEGWVTRLFRIERDSVFVSKVHEYVTPIRGGKKKIYATSCHSGYVFLTQEERRKHYERNTALLFEMIEKEPQNLRWKMQLMMEYVSMREWNQLESLCKQCIDEIENGGLRCTDEMLCSFISGYIYAIEKQERYQEVLERVDEYISHPRCVDILKWQFYYKYTKNYGMTKQWELVTKYGRQFIEVAEDEEKVKKVVLLQNKVFFLGETFYPARVEKVYGMVIVSGLKQGSTDLLYELYDKLYWDRDFCNIDITEVVEAFGTLPYAPIFGRLITDAYRNEKIRPYMSMEAEKYVEDTEAYRNIMYAYAQAESDDEYIWRAKLQVADWSNDIDKIVEELKKGYTLTEDVFNAHKVIAYITDKYSIDLSTYWAVVPPENWKLSVQRYLAKSQDEDIQKLTGQIQRVFDEESWKRRYYEMYLAMYELQKEDGLTYEAMEQKFYNYMVGVLEYYRNLYPDEDFMREMETLPTEVRAAVYLNEFFGKAEDDFEGRIASLRECANACEGLGEKVKVFAKLIGERKLELERKAAQSARNELAQMVELMKIRICQMIEQGLREEAKSVLVQVRALAPTDQELIEMEEMLSQ